MVDGACRTRSGHVRSTSTRGGPPVRRLAVLPSRARGPPSPSTPAFESVEVVATRCQCLSLRWCTNPMQGFHGFDAATYVIRREQEFFHFEVVDQFGVVLPRSNI